jgi:SAM-dependent methyltransferase
MNFDHLEHAYSKRAFLYDAINAASPWHLLHRRITSRRLAQLIPNDHLSSGSQTRVLDLAAGTGLAARELIDRGCFVTLVDVLPSMCDLARQAIPDTHSVDSEIFCASAVSFRDFEPASYDAVVCTQAFNFFDQPALVIETAARALKPGGVFYFDTDTAHRWVIIEALAGHVDNALSIAEQGIDVARNIVGADYYFHSASALTSALEQNGFTHIALSGMLYIVPLLHLFNQSAEFLDPSSLNPAVQRLFASTTIDQLLDLEERLTQLWPIDSAGYHVFSANRK